jgi:hypothetical protein
MMVVTTIWQSSYKLVNLEPVRTYNAVDFPDET